ncbi:MAG: polyprenyl synthetase family protein, partial [bacterium]
MVFPVPALIREENKTNALPHGWEGFLEEAIIAFKSRYREILWSDHPQIDRIVAYLSKTQGKGIRPILTLLCASLNGQQPSPSAIDAAVVVELLHEATLVHDDVVDEASVRRGFLSLPARFHNKVAVLFGDYLLATVLAKTLSIRDFQWLDILSETARRMARGELLQATRARRMDMRVEEYFEMVKDKTGALFNASCRLGGLSAGLSSNEIEILGSFGDHLGIAFQIRDDLLDLFGDHRTGKLPFTDLKGKKLTLPLLFALQDAK